MTSWKEQIQKQAKLLVREIAMLENTLDPEGSTSSIEVLMERLEDLYSGGLAIANLRDRSDLVLRLQGNAFDSRPRLQLVTSIFENVSSRVTDLTKVILGSGADGKISPSSLDLSLSGVAKGSLLFGLSADIANQKSPNLLQDHDTLYVSTRDALKSINLVAHLVEDNDDVIHLEEVSERIDNPRVRDAALLAVQRLAPSGRRGIDALSVSSLEGIPARLTSDHRKAIRQSLTKPVIHGEEIRLLGYVREIDLDAHRFDLRGIDDEQIRDVRCAYRSLPNIRPRNLLGSYVRVDGLVERTADGVPRLLSVTDVDIRNQPPDDIGMVDDEDTPLPFLKGE